MRYNFNPYVMQAVVGGISVLDTPSLNIRTLSEADQFIRSYGFDPEKDIEKLWYYHRRAVVLLTEKMNFNLADIPEMVHDRKILGDIRNLLLWASDHQHGLKQRWSCAFLRVMHVFVHSENDLFSFFAEEIQQQILTPIQDHIFHDGGSGKTFLKRVVNPSFEEIELLGFETKPFKTSSSTVIKLLAKSNVLALNVFDKLGVRFVTKSLFDSFSVVRFLVKENLVNHAHVIPDQSSNTLYPLDLFLSVTDELRKTNTHFSDEDLHEHLLKSLQANQQAQYLEKENSFSGADYRFIKFIARRLIHIAPDGSKEGFSFFYPYEVQIMDQAAYQKILTGPAVHQAYKERQMQAARSRVFPPLDNP